MVCAILTNHTYTCWRNKNGRLKRTTFTHNSRKATSFASVTSAGRGGLTAVPITNMHIIFSVSAALEKSLYFDIIYYVHIVLCMFSVYYADT